MDVRAILLVAPPSDASVSESVAGVPIALLDVLGKSPLERMIDRLRQFGITRISAVSDDSSTATQVAGRISNKDIVWAHANGTPGWRVAEKAFSDHSEAGADLVLVIRLGAYADFDFDDLVQFHLDQHGRVTVACTPDGLPLDIAAIASSRRNDAAFLFRHGLRQFRTATTKYIFRGYVNRLRGLADLRQLAWDGLTFRAQIPPVGAETRPGVWVAPGARVQRGARILAPAYIGSRSKIRAAAVITRGSVVEHHAIVDCGTVVENSTVLPFTYLGAGLDVAHAVVGFRRLVHLRRGVEVDISDSRLVGTVSPHAPLRALGHAVSLATFLPAQLVRGFFAPSHREAPAQLPAAVQAPSPALNTPQELQPAEAADAAQFPANLMVARRYGDQ